MKPLIYISGPYSGDETNNTRRACLAGTEVMNGGVATPIVPHLSFIWDVFDPKPYEAWIAYDLELLELCDAMWRLPGPSKGADIEQAHAAKHAIPVFGTLAELVHWCEYRTGERWKGWP